MRNRWVVLGAVGVVVVVLAGLGWWKLVDHRPRVAAGASGLVDRFDEHPPTAHKAAIRTPTIRFDLAVGNPTSELPPHCCVEKKATHRAPSGGSFVGVHVSTPTTMPWVVAATSQWQRPTFSLVDGNHTYRLAGIDSYLSPSGPWTTSGVTEYVALPDKPAHVSVIVFYDGSDQVFDTADDSLDEGQAAALYKQPDRPPAGKACVDTWPAPYVAGRGASASTRLARLEVPWVPTLGWAKSGHTWLVGGYTRSEPSTFTVKGASGVLYSNDDAGRDDDAFTAEDAVRVLTADGVHPRALAAMTAYGTERVVWDIEAGAHPVVRSTMRITGRQVEGPPRQDLVTLTVRTTCR